MCDTLFRKLKNGYVFGKNSDRNANEPNLTLFYPRRKSTNKDLQCTYIKVDEVSETNALLLIQPSWMWGGEMGINEHGVMIGNEAVFTYSRGKKVERLLGMDLLRLGLERGKSAKECLDIIVLLLEKYGQGGNCGFNKPFYYDNSFLIADKNKAFILETSGKEWVSYEISSHYNISNRLSLNDGYLNGSNKRKNFAKRNREPIFSFFSGSKIRFTSASGCLAIADFNLQTMMKALRQHQIEDDQKLFQKGSVKSVCMHQSFLGDHTTSSMIVSFKDNHQSIWITGCSTPCLAIYKPVYFGDLIPPVFTDPQESLKYWLDREYLVRAIYANLIDLKTYRDQIIKLQNKFIEEEEKLIKRNASKEDFLAFSLKCSQEEHALVDSYQEQIALVKEEKDKLPKIWKKLTETLGINVFETDLKKRLGKH